MRSFEYTILRKGGSQILSTRTVPIASNKSQASGLTGAFLDLEATCNPNLTHSRGGKQGEWGACINHIVESKHSFNLEVLTH